MKRAKKDNKQRDEEKWMSFVNLNLNFRTATFSTFDHHYLENLYVLRM